MVMSTVAGQLGSCELGSDELFSGVLDTVAVRPAVADADRLAVLGLGEAAADVVGVAPTDWAPVAWLDGAAPEGELRATMVQPAARNDRAAEQADNGPRRAGMVSPRGIQARISTLGLCPPGFP
jgi:hypothetical protein